VAFFMSPTDS